MEEWREVLEVVWDWPLLALAALVVLLVSAGSGRRDARWRRRAWIAGLVLLGLSLSVGLGRHEWRDVLFNGQLL